MKKISDFNRATEKYPVVYAGSATHPEFVNMPTTLQQQEGVAPMDTLPAQWWNSMWKLATKDINAFRDYVGDAFTEINNLLTKFGITLDDADSEQLYDFFHNDYVQNYLNNIFVNKNGDTIDGDLHIKGNLSVDGIGDVKGYVDGKIDDTTKSDTKTWSSSKIYSSITEPQPGPIIEESSTVDTGFSLAQGEGSFYGRLLQIDGHISNNASTMSFLIFVKANYDNPTSVYATQIAGLYDTTNNTTYTSYFDLGVSNNGTLTIKNKTLIIARYRFI